MLAKAYTKYIRISPRKVGLVIDLVKGKNLEEAMAILDNVNKMARFPLKKTLSSAFANLNSVRSDKVLAKDVVISTLLAESGPTLHRYRAATMGRATPVKHRTCHIYVELDKTGVSAGEAAAAKEAAEPAAKRTGAAPDKTAKRTVKKAVKEAKKPATKIKTAKSGSK